MSKETPAAVNQGIDSKEKCISDNNETKRKTIASLEAARKRSSQPVVDAENGRKELIALQRRLKSSEATNKMLEETVEAYEEKILDAITENGSLHKVIEETRQELLDAKMEIATLRRQRNGLRQRVEAQIETAEIHRDALAAAERELIYMNSLLLDSVDEPTA